MNKVFVENPERNNGGGSEAKALVIRKCSGVRTPQYLSRVGHFCVVDGADEEHNYDQKTISTILVSLDTYIGSSKVT